MSMGPKVNFSDEDQALVRQANFLLEQLHSPTRVSSVQDIGADVFVTLYEGLCGEQLSGVVRNPVIQQQAIQNCQCVIQALASDVLHTSLEHISAVDIVDGDVDAISNLLEIFSGLLEYILNKIESESSTDGEGEADDVDDDPDAVTPEVIDQILEAELRNSHLTRTLDSPPKPTPSAFWEEEPVRTDKVSLIDKTQDVIDLLHETPKLRGQRTPMSENGNSTSQLIKEGDYWEKHLQTEEPLVRPTASSKYLTNGRVNVGSEASGLTSGRLVDIPVSGHVSELGPSSMGAKTTIASRFPTEPVVTTSQPSVQQSNGYVPEVSPRDPARRIDVNQEYISLPVTMPVDERLGRYRSMYQPSSDTGSLSNLQEMVEKTAAMARAAVDASPARAKNMLHRMDRDLGAASPVKPSVDHRIGTEGSRSRLDRSPIRTAATEGMDAKSPARKTDVDRSTDAEWSPSRAKRKVSFLVERSTSDSSPSFDRTSPRPVTRAWVHERDKPGSPQKNVTAKPQTKPISPSRRPRSAPSKPQELGSYLDVDYLSDRENQSYDDILKRQFHEIIDDVLSDEEPLSQYRVASDRRYARLRDMPEKDREIFTIRDTQKLLKEEKQSGKKKMDFLHKIYREDMDEIENEAKYELYKDKRVAKDKEKDYKKKVLRPPKTATSKHKAVKVYSAPTVAAKKTPSKTLVSTKAKKRSKTVGGAPAPTPRKKQTLTIRDDDDILPLLLEEFPHLHLSLHTWHELWRKGLQQIEQITRANQEVRRKKSHAQTQLEEAEQRQQLMIKIMRKELEHAQRLKDVKERRTQHVVATNRLHEKRIQSARSRQYYDDYHVRMRSKMLKRRTREEMVFKKLFKDGLEIQKDRIRELRKYAGEQRDKQAKTQRNEIESMENYYRDQFEMLAETVSTERNSLAIREKAQQKVLEQMKKELRKKMEKEIRDFQEHLCRDDDDAYFRQLDADRVIHDLQVAKYHVRV